jgi:hypothetical protein
VHAKHAFGDARSQSLGCDGATHTMVWAPVIRRRQLLMFQSALTRYASSSNVEDILIRASRRLCVCRCSQGRCRGPQHPHLLEIVAGLTLRGSLDISRSEIVCQRRPFGSTDTPCASHNTSAAGGSHFKLTGKRFHKTITTRGGLRLPLVVRLDHPPRFLRGQSWD